ncbi:hypothetical protein WAI453_013037 [Rhynchosporium graminicola]
MSHAFLEVGKRERITFKDHVSPGKSLRFVRPKLKITLIFTTSQGSEDYDEEERRDPDYEAFAYERGRRTWRTW